MSLFNLIFENGYVSDKRLSLTNNKFKELLDHNKLAFILQNEKVIKSDINRKARDEVELMSYYNKAHHFNDITGEVSVCYYQPAGGLYGRYQARGKLSGQGILREVRFTIFNNFYYDLDIVNAHPVILLWLCNHLNITTTYLNEYVLNREKHISDILKLNSEISRDDVKAIFLSINNGGLSSYKQLIYKTDFLISYKNELQDIINQVVSHFNPFYNIVSKMKHIRGEDFNINGATISHILQYVENQLLMIIFKYVEERIGAKAYESILCYDGIMLLKSSFDENWKYELETLFQHEYGINISLKIKEMIPLDLSKYGFDDDERYRLNYEDSITGTDISSYRSILDEPDTSREIDLINGNMFDVDIVNYVRSFGEDFISTDDNLYRFNGIWWECINEKYVYHLLEIVYIRLKRVVNGNNILYSYITDNIDKEKHRKHLIKKVGSLNKQTVCKSIYALIKSKYLESSNPFDNNINIIGFTNGVFDLEKYEFRSSTKDDYISMVLPYDYTVSSSEDIEYVLNYLSKIMPIKEELELLLMLLATGLSGIVLNHFIICSGLGSNGKDALFNYLLKSALGPYYYRANNSVITERIKGDLNVGISNMNKKRSIVFSEPSDKCKINVALVKELTGGNEINARGLYSSNTTVNLHSTFFMLCNDKPLLDKVDAAIANRLIVFRFRSLFKSKEYLQTNDITEGENYIFTGDESIKKVPFLLKYRLPFINLLLPYYQRFQQSNYMITNIPESIRIESCKYMEESDPIYNWLYCNYDKTNNKSDIVKLKDVFGNFKNSEYYFNLTKEDKRRLSYKWFIEYVEKSPLLRASYKERIKTVSNITIRNALIKFTIKPVVECEEDN